MPRRNAWGELHATAARLQKCRAPFRTKSQVCRYADLATCGIMNPRESVTEPQVEAYEPTWGSVTKINKNKNDTHTPPLFMHIFPAHILLVFSSCSPRGSTRVTAPILRALCSYCFTTRVHCSGSLTLQKQVPVPQLKSEHHLPRP
jgi:hypothetical protein